MPLNDTEFSEYESLSSLKSLNDLQMGRLEALDNQSKISETPKESFWQKITPNIPQGVNKFTEPWGFIEKPLQTISGAVTRGTEAIEQGLKTPGLLQGVRTATKIGTAVFPKSPADVALAVGTLGGSLGYKLGKTLISDELLNSAKLLRNAPAEIKAVEIPKLAQKFGEQPVQEAMTLAEQESDQGIAALNKSKLVQQAHNAPKPLPATWQSTTPIFGEAPKPKPFSLQAGLPAEEQSALEAFKAKLPQGPAKAPTLAPEAVITPKATIPPIPAPVVPVIKATGPKYVGNLNITGMGTEEAKVLASLNEATGFAEKTPMNIENIKSMGLTDSGRKAFEAIVTSEPGSLAGSIYQRKQGFHDEVGAILKTYQEAGKSIEETAQALISKVPKGAQISKVSAENARALQIQQQFTQPAEVLVNQLENLKTKLAKSPISDIAVKSLSALQKYLDSKAAELAKTSKIYKALQTVNKHLYFDWVNSILSGPMTQLVNIGGDFAFAVSKPLEKVAESAFHAVTFHGADAMTALKEAGYMVKGGGGYLGEEVGKLLQAGGKAVTGNFGEAGNILAKGNTRVPFDVTKQMGKFDTALSNPFLETFKGTTGIGGKIGRGAGNVIGLPTNLMQKGDSAFKKLIAAMEIPVQASRGVTGEALQKNVINEALYRTFQNKLGPLADSLVGIKNAIPGAEWVLPFVKTPANLIARGIERSPFNVLKIIGKQIKYGKNYNHAEAAKDFGQFAVGSAAAGIMAYGYMKGKITGAYPKDKDERERWTAQGKVPYAMMIRGKWQPLIKIDPFGVSLKSLVSMIDSYKNSDEELPQDKVIGAGVAFGKDLANTSYLANFNTLVKAIFEPDRTVGKVGRSIGSGFMPRLASTFNQDPYQRAQKTTLEMIKAKTPYLSETLPMQRDILGNPIMKARQANATPELDFAKILNINLPDTRTITKPITPLTTQDNSDYRNFVGFNMKALFQKEMAKNKPDYTEEEIKDIQSRVVSIVEDGKAVFNTKAELRRLGINASPDISKASDIYKYVLKGKNYKTATDEQKKTWIIQELLNIEEP